MSRTVLATDFVGSYKRGVKSGCDNKALGGGGVTVKLTHERLWPHGCNVRVFADSCAYLQMAGS